MVFGASGFIGRWLVRELLGQDVTTAAVVRSDSSADQLLHWLKEHQAPSLPEVVRAGFDRDYFGWRPGQAPVATEVYNMAGAYAFGMTTAQARAANVDTARRVVSFAATLPGLVRLVHLSGYRVGGQDPATVPWTTQRINAQYRRLGAYEASKVESDAVVQSHATNLGVPFSIVNPSTDIGDSHTGESPQTLGLGTTVLDLLAGRMPALPGGHNTFVPIVTVDYLATFAALLATRADTDGLSYWVLADTTPPLPDLLGLIGDDHGVDVPRIHVPVALLKRLPSKIARRPRDPELPGHRLLPHRPSRRPGPRARTQPPRCRRVPVPLEPLPGPTGPAPHRARRTNRAPQRTGDANTKHRRTLRRTTTEGHRRAREGVGGIIVRSSMDVLSPAGTDLA